MSSADVRAALEVALSAMSPELATAWENTAYKPVVGRPYQRAAIIRATPRNDEYGRAFSELGIFQVSLHYPPGQGAKDAEARLDLIRATFFRGASFVKNSVVVTIISTPAALPATDDDQGRYVLPVSIQFKASLQN